MVQIIQNPTYTGLQDPAGNSIAEAMNGIAGAFMNTAQGDVQRAALAANARKQAGQVRAASAIGDMTSGKQIDPTGVAQAFIDAGMDPTSAGKILQLTSGANGGINAPGVAIGSLPGGAYKETPQGINEQNQFELKKQNASQTNAASLEPYMYVSPNGTPAVTNKAVASRGVLPNGGVPLYSTDQQKADMLNRFVYGPTASPATSTTPTAPSAAQPASAAIDDTAGTAPAAPVPSADQRVALGLDSNKTTPYNIGWTDAAGVKHNLVSADPTTDIAKLGIGQFNPTVANANGGGTTINVGGADSAAQTEAKAEAQKSGEAAGERQNTMLKAAATAPDNIARYTTLRDVLAHSNTGPGTELKGTVVGWANAAGIPPSVIEAVGLNPNQAVTNDIAQKLTNKMVAESIGARNGGFPATGFNVQERQFIEKMYPSIGSQPGANLANSDMLIAMEQQKQDMADEFGAYRMAQRQAGKAPSFSDFEDKYRAAHKGDNIFQPIIDNFNAGKYGPVGAPAPTLNPVAGQQQPLAPVQGAKQAPDGNWYVPDPARSGKYLRVDGAAR